MPNFIRHQILGRLAKPQGKFRARRMAAFLENLNVRAGQRVIDLGGHTAIWDSVEIPLDITIINLPGYQAEGDTSHSKHKFTFIEGDATNMPDHADNSFDLVFSNSVIEHVGDEAKQAAFAREARRLAPAYWVQTPSIHFPLEPHTGMPFWWYYPKPLREAIFKRWHANLPDWAESMEGTTVIKKSTLRRFFPDAVITTERLFGLPKSYACWRAAR